MNEGTIPIVSRSVSGLPPRLRGRVVLTFVIITLTACLVAAALSVSRAVDERRAIGDRALDAAKSLSLGFDQEVAAVNYLLKGLSRSPALLNGDTQAFYRQLKETPVPEGSWLVLNDMEGQVVNTLRPFGSSLPRHAEFPSHREQLDRIRERGWSVSGRMTAPLNGSVVVALSLRLDSPDGRVNGHITTTLTEARLGAIMGDQTAPSAWEKGLYDRTFQTIVVERDGRDSSSIPAPAALSSRFADAGPDGMSEGKIEAVDDQGKAVLVAFRRSNVTSWTTAVIVPRENLDAPIAAALWQMAGPATLLSLAGAFAAWFTARQMEQPLRTLSDQVSGAKHQVSELSGQLLALQEDERQRLARELHDSTAQRLVAADLGLAGLKPELRHSKNGRKVLAEVEDMLTEALRELRIFTYLLHPPNLAREGLQATLRDFAEGFAGRTGLIARIRIAEEVDVSAPDLQRAILRIVQEALTNVHRHAGASHVSVDAGIRSGQLVVRIRDDGHGMTDPARSDGPARLGVGIAGMRARLEQFDGDLRIRSGPSGTSVVAIVPVTVAGRALIQARRMLEPWRSAPNPANRKTLH
ncbi:sensor histidine kinase [Microvirga sp. ACRRW]|uniref:sensor histidine kinase n=1 Tax=Microvirga sp. ACRRW TaxID=2918205 RepID=UPI001EF6B232|nr:histidine kinase [Microvirga sp. ACRRW]MCG7392836.1 sensor histidine kinase [Microvirga sp. ACRRW]